MELSGASGFWGAWQGRPWASAAPICLVARRGDVDGRNMLTPVSAGLFLGTWGHSGVTPHPPPRPGGPGGRVIPLPWPGLGARGLREAGFGCLFPTSLLSPSAGPGRPQGGPWVVLTPGGLEATPPARLCVPAAPRVALVLSHDAESGAHLVFLLLCCAGAHR